MITVVQIAQIIPFLLNGVESKWESFPFNLDVI